jgi:hypothetical protein
VTYRRRSPRTFPADSKQIIRLNAYEQAHPDVSIGYDHVYGYWQAIITTDGWETTVVRYGLATMLDRLSELEDGR